jgi:hypothetical protein
MEDAEIKERLEKVYKRANIDPCYAQPVFDWPVDRVLAVKLSDISDLLVDMDLCDVHRLVQLAMRIGMDPDDREGVENFERKMLDVAREIVDEQLRRKQQEESDDNELHQSE